MRKVVKILALGAAFTLSTFFMSCSDTIHEDEAQSIEQASDTRATQEETSTEHGRCCFGGKHGNGGNSISGQSYSNRGDRSGRSHR